MNKKLIQLVFLYLQIPRIIIQKSSIHNSILTHLISRSLGQYAFQMIVSDVFYLISKTLLTIQHSLGQSILRQNDRRNECRDLKLKCSCWMHSVQNGQRNDIPEWECESEHRALKRQRHAIQINKKLATSLYWISL